MANEVTYYPAQKLLVSDAAVGGSSTALKLVQSADIDFSISRQDVNEFGTFWAVDTIQVEPATANLNFSYALGSGANNHTLLGLDSFETFLNNVNGFQYTLSGAGQIVMPSGLINSFSVEGSVGNVPTVTVGVQALNATYTAGNPAFPAQGGTASVSNVIRPDQLSISLGGTVYECRSFTYTLDIPREYINKLGSLTPIANIITAPPRVTVEAEIILRSLANPKFGNNDATDVIISCGDAPTINYEVDDAKISNFTSNTTLDDVQVASITLEAPVKGYDQITIGG